jgi:beta-lactam-binding protein with PASTA domain
VVLLVGLAVVSQAAQATVAIAQPAAVLARNADGRLEAFARDLEGNMAHRWQVSAGSDTWTEWHHMDGSMRSFSAEAGADDRLELWGVDANGLVWRRSQTTAGADSWTQWSPMGGYWSSVALARLSDGRLEVWGVQTDGQVVYRTQNPPNADGSPSWSSPSVVGGALLSTLSTNGVAAQLRGDGRLEVWGVSSTGAVYRSTETLPNSGVYPAFTAMDGALRANSPIALALNADGHLEVFGADSSNHVLRRVQTFVNSSGGVDTETWPAWSTLTSPIEEVASLGAEANVDGHLDLVVSQMRDLGNPAYWRMNQTATGWTTPIQFDVNHNLGPLLAKPQLNASGTAVDLTWTDKSDNEDLFEVYHRIGATMQLVTSVTTRNKGLTGDVYTFTDTALNSDTTLRCYVVMAKGINVFATASVDLCVGNFSDPFYKLDPPSLGVTSVTASSVTVSFTDRSSNEARFTIEKRTAPGSWKIVQIINSIDTLGIDHPYTWVDYETAISGQCYRVYATNAYGQNLISGERCGVRPDPSRFPQTVPDAVVQWNGLSQVNDGTGTLHNTVANQHLYHDDHTFDVDLSFRNTESLWRVKAQGGPHLMLGQQLAIRVWGGGWLERDNGFIAPGVGLTLDTDTAAYEWYALGNNYNTSIYFDVTLNTTHFALWNSDRGDFLIYDPLQGNASGLGWYKILLARTNPPSSDEAPTPQPPLAQAGVGYLRMFNCAAAQHPVTVWVNDTTAGSGFQNKGTLAYQSDAVTGCVAKDSTPFRFTPVNAHSYEVVVTDPLQTGCTTNDPANGDCVVQSTTFTGNPAGAIQTTTVGQDTDRSPFAFNGLQSTMPSLTGQSVTNAQASLTAANLTVGTITTVLGSGAANTVTAQATPTNTVLPINSTVDVTVTIGAALSSSQVQNYTTKQFQAQVITLPASGGLQPYTWTATNLPAGVSITSGVIAGTPTTAGTSTTSYTVTDAAGATQTKTFTWTVTPMSTVPNLIGQPQTAVSSILQSAGLVLGTIAKVADNNLCNNVGNVAAQFPAPGTLVNPGTAVNITVYKAPTSGCF